MLERYVRPDQSLYEKTTRIEKYPVTIERISFKHHDADLFSEKITPYQVSYQNKIVLLDPVYEKIEYVFKNNEVVPQKNTFNVQDRKIDLSITNYYKRGDETVFKQTIVCPHSVDALQPFFVHNDLTLTSHQKIPYRVVYKGTIVDLEPQGTSISVGYTMQNTRQDFDRKQIRIENNKVMHKSVPISVMEIYKRVDNTIYKVEKTETSQVQTEERIDRSDNKKYTDYYIILNQSRTILSTSDEYIGGVLGKVPSFTRGFENVYNRFINGKLVFDNGQGQTKTFEFSQFKDTLNGEFDLSDLTVDGDVVNEYLRIKLGIRQKKEKDDKVTVWFTPKFMVDQSNSVWRNQTWSSDVGIFWSYGNWGLNDFDYLTSQKFDEISHQNLFKLWRGRGSGGCWTGWETVDWGKNFSLHFN